MLHRTSKGGLGAAYVAGFGWALERGYDVAGARWMPTARTSPSSCRACSTALHDADLVAGLALGAGRRGRELAGHRKLLSVGGNTYVRLALGVPLRDATGGFRAYRRQVLEGIDVEQVESQGYCFQVDLAWRAWRSGFRVVEVPITFVERVRGESKMSERDRRRGAVAGHRSGASRRSARAASATHQPAARYSPAD